MDEIAAVIDRLPRWLRLLAVGLLVLAWALAVPRGGIAAIVVVTISAVTVLFVAYFVADARDRAWLIAVALFAILARDTLVGLIDVTLLSQGSVWYAPDERTYLERAALVYRLWLDPTAPFDHNDPHVRSWYVHLIARLYQLVGGENTVVVKLVNTTLAVVGALLMYRTMRNLGLGGARWATALLLIFPSVTFWTALTLKDSFVIFFLMSSLWATSEFIRSRRAWWLAVAVLALLPLESVRTYIFATGALALLFVPLALAGWKDRIRVGAGLLATVYLMFAVIQPFRDFGANIWYIPIFLRGAAAQGARTAFVEPAPVVKGEPGEHIVIAVTGVTPAPGVTPRVVVVDPGTQILVQVGANVPIGTPSGQGRPTPAIVRPGDIVQIASSASASASHDPRLARTILVDPEAKNTVGLTSEIDPDATSFTGSLQTNIRHLPLGLLHALFAPFPWTARTLEQLATIPEMLLWYLCLVAALFGTVTLLWRRNMSFAHGFAMTAGLLIVLSLIGANVGTLIRSRAMLIPYVLMLAGVGISLLLERYPHITARWNDVVSRARRTARGRA